MNLRSISIAALLLVGVGVASAAIVPVGEFTGDAYEGFEGIIAPGPYSGPMPVFGSAGTFDDTYSDPWIANSLSSGSGDTLFPYGGNLMGLTPTGWTTFTFATPVYKFGGYMGTVNTVSGGNVTFYDGEGLTLEALSFDLPLASWTWRGWESDVPVGSITIHTGANPGFTGVYDDMQLSYVPEPGALALLAAGVVMLIRRR